MKVLEALYSKLAHTVAVTEKLSTYEFTTAQDECPAIFTLEKTPSDSEYPCLIMTIVSSTPFQTRGQRGLEARIDVRVYGNREMSESDFRSLCDEVWKCLDRADLETELTEAGYDTCLVSASYPRTFGETDDYPSAWVNVRLVALLSE